MTLLALKLTLVPALIAGITLAGRRWGHGVAGWLSAFPVVAGPLLLFMSIEQGPAFAAAAAEATFSAIIAVVLFGLAYAHAAQRHGCLTAYLSGLLAFGLAIAMLAWLQPSFWLAAAYNVSFLLLAPRLYPADTLPDATEESLSHSPLELPARMLAAGMLVITVTAFAGQLGAHFSGLGSMYPVMGSVLAVFTHHKAGAAAAAHLLKASVNGWYAFATFTGLLAWLLPHLSVANSFTVALLAALAAQAVMYHRLPTNAQPPRVR